MVRETRRERPRGDRRLRGGVGPGAALDVVRPQARSSRRSSNFRLAARPTAARASSSPTTRPSNFIQGGTNRVILGTDGDFNVGITNQDDLIRLIESKAKSGVFLSVLGFGMGNLKDATMEKLADKGNGHYAYIDTLREARKVLVDEMGSTLVTIAKDVKIQVEFNPAQVAAYRLIGYENRLLPSRTSTTTPRMPARSAPGTTSRRSTRSSPRARRRAARRRPAQVPEAKPAERTGGDRPESLIVKLRYKAPDGDKSKLIKLGVVDMGASYGTASDDFKFAAAVAGFGMLLRDSPHKGSLTYDAVLELASSAANRDAQGYRHKFIALVRKAQMLSK